MAIFRTRDVKQAHKSKASKAPWGARVHRIEGRDVGVRINRQGQVADTVKWAMPADFSYSDAETCRWEKEGRQSKVDRGKCWIQLAIVDGEPHLRVCRKNNEPGALIPVDNPTHARILSRELCDSYEKARGDWSKFSKSLPKGHRIGAVRPRASGTHCVFVRGRSKPVRCFKKRATAVAYRKRMCARARKCSLTVGKRKR